jgi:hypothetical protein
MSEKRPVKSKAPGWFELHQDKPSDSNCDRIQWLDSMIIVKQDTRSIE